MTEEEPPLTCSFHEIVVNRARKDPVFRAMLVEEAMQALADGDTETARTLLRDVADAALPHPGSPAP